MADVEFESVNGADVLELDGDPHLGPSVPSVPPGTTPSPEFRARIHESPIAFSIKDLINRAKKKTTAKLYERFDLWLVPHRFSINRISGSSKIVRAGCEVQYADTGQSF